MEGGSEDVKKTKKGKEDLGRQSYKIKEREEEEDIRNKKCEKIWREENDTYCEPLETARLKNNIYRSSPHSD